MHSTIPPRNCRYREEQIGDPMLADGILDRLVHNAHRIEMRGDSMRKNRGKPNA
jgi:DNA replication protein DnaC